MNKEEQTTELIVLQGSRGSFLVPCLFVRSPRSTRMRMVWTPQKFLRLSLPTRCSMKEGVRFLQQSGLWIEKQMENQSRQPGLWEYFRKEKRISWHGRWLNCQIEFGGERKEVRLVRQGRGHNLKIRHPAVFTENDFALAELLNRFARSYLPERVAMLAEERDVTVKRISVRNQVSRWGSCSQRGEISLNWRLILLPPALQDYIILHELAHRKHFNHSRRFWDLLTRWDPKTPIHDREIRGDEGSKILHLGR